MARGEQDVIDLLEARIDAPMDGEFDTTEGVACKMLVLYWPVIQAAKAQSVAAECLNHADYQTASSLYAARLATENAVRAAASKARGA